MRHRQDMLWVCGIGLLLLVGAVLRSGIDTANAAVPFSDGSDIQSPADSLTACVHAPNSGCDAACGAGCFADMQVAVNLVPTGGTVRVAAGTYTRYGSSVIQIAKPLTLRGGYDASCGTPDAGVTVLDGENTKTVVKVLIAGGMVELSDLHITRGMGGPNCGASYAGCGGGLFVQETPVKISRCTFTGNTGSQIGTGAGGGVFIDNATTGSYAEINTSLFTENIASTYNKGWGGGLSMDAGSKLTPALITGTTFMENYASNIYEGYGGAVALSGYVKVDKSDFVRNYAAVDYALWGYGGAMYLWQTKYIDLSNNLFNLNVALQTPGPFSESKGGALFATTNITMTAVNNIFSRNDAKDAGTAIYFESTEEELPVTAYLWNNTIGNNWGNPTSGAVTVGDNAGVTHAELVNNIIAANPYGIQIKNPAQDTVIADTNCIWNTTQGYIGDFPLLVDPFVTALYYPKSGSPIMGAGIMPSKNHSNLIRFHPYIALDRDGVTRPLVSLWPNIGVYETTRIEFKDYMPFATRH